MSETWHVCDKYRDDIRSESGELIAMVYPADTMELEEARANLIASAPSMLEALESYRTTVGCLLDEISEIPIRTNVDKCELLATKALALARGSR